jgi:hypothetical protein
MFWISAMVTLPADEPGGIMRARSAIILALVLTASACGKAEPAGPPVAVQPSEVEALVFQSTDLSEKQISMEGYFGFDNGPKGDAIAMGPELTTQPMGHGDTLIRFDVDRGTGPNQLNLHEIGRNELADLPVAPVSVIFDMNKTTYQDAEGVAHPLRARVRVTGRLHYARLGANLMSDEDSRSPTGRRFKPQLVDVTLEPTS